MRVLAVDPGPSTGYCLYNLETGWHEVWQEELSKREPHHALYVVLSVLDFDILIAERFVFNQDNRDKAKIDYLAAELYGVCALYAQDNQHIRFVRHQASNVVGKTAFWGDSKEGNDKIRTLGLWSSEARPHGMDALRHVLYYVTFELNDQRFLQKLR